MKVLKKYLKKMSVQRYAYCRILLLLMEKGWKYREAKILINKSRIIDYVKKNEKLFFHAYPEDWIQWVYIRCNLL